MYKLETKELKMSESFKKKILHLLYSYLISSILEPPTCGGYDVSI